MPRRTHRKPLKPIRKKRSVLLQCVLCCFSFFLVFGVCGHPTVEKQVISSPMPPGVTIESYIYDSAQSKTYLQKNLHSFGYQPVEIIIKNNTSYAYVLSEDGVSLPTANLNAVSFKAFKKGIPRALAFKAATLAYPPFHIVSAIDTIKNMKSNAKFKKRLGARLVKAEGEEILPFSTVERVLLVPKDKHQSDFSLTLIDKATGRQEVFQVHALNK